MNRRQLLHSIRYNACQMKIECVAKTATLNNYDYLLNLSKRMDAISASIRSIGEDFASEPVANIVANSIHRTMMRLIPSFGLGNFDWDGIGEDLAIIVGNAAWTLESCDEDGLAQGVCDKYNLFITMCELQERLDEEWLTTIAND